MDYRRQRGHVDDGLDGSIISTTKFTIGNQHENGNFYFTGQMDDVRVDVDVINLTSSSITADITTLIKDYFGNAVYNNTVNTAISAYTTHVQTINPPLTVKGYYGVEVTIDVSGDPETYFDCRFVTN